MTFFAYPVLLNEEARQLAMNNPMHHNIEASALLARGRWSFTNHTTQSGRGKNGGLKPARLLSLWEAKSYRGSMLGTSRQTIWSSQVHGKDKVNKPAYAAVEKPTIPPEVSDKKQASSTKSFRTRFSKSIKNWTIFMLLSFWTLCWWKKRKKWTTL